MKNLTLLSLFTFVLCLWSQTPLSDSEFDGLSIGMSFGGAIEPVKNVGFREAKFSQGTLSMPHREGWDIKRRTQFATIPSVTFGKCFGKFYVGSEASLSIMRKRERMDKFTKINIMDSSFAHDTSIHTVMRDSEPCLDFKFGYNFIEHCLFYGKFGTSKNKIIANVRSHARLTDQANDNWANYERRFTKNKYAFRSGIGMEYKINEKTGIRLDHTYMNHGRIKINGSTNFNNANGLNMSLKNTLNFHHSVTSLGVNFYH